MASTIIVTGDKLRKRKKRLKITKIVLLILLFLLISIFLILSIVYKGGRFTVTLDPNFSLKSGIVIYETLEDKRSQRKLYASELEFMDNISVEWIPKNIASEAEGSHNGKNYIAYTFYIENQGTETLDYWYQIVIDDVIKNVDDAVRIMIYRNDEKTIYAKKNEDLNASEKDTTPFYSKEYAVLENRKDFKPNDIDKYTIVIWLEGDDPECLDNIIGGEIKMHMEIIEEHIDQKVENEEEKGKEEK